MLVKLLNLIGFYFQLIPIKN